MTNQLPPRPVHVDPMLSTLGLIADAIHKALLLNSTTIRYSQVSRTMREVGIVCVGYGYLTAYRRPVVLEVVR